MLHRSPNFSKDILRASEGVQAELEQEALGSQWSFIKVITPLQVTK